MATIQLSISASPVVTSAGLRLQLTVRNGGDAPARNVMPIVAFRGSETLGTFEPLVEAGRTVSQTIAIPLESPAAIRGTWPLYCHIAYADGNNHPFEALHVMTIGFGSPVTAKSPITVDVGGARFSTSGQASVQLHSTISAESSVSFIVPTGVAVAPDHASVFLEPGTRTMAPLVTNAGATASSRLPLFAVVEFDAGGEHATAIGSGVLEIAPGSGPPSAWVMPSVLIALTAVWFAVAVIRRRRTTSPGPAAPSAPPR
jgi:hypothetical protein